MFFHVRSVLVFGASSINGITYAPQYLTPTFMKNGSGVLSAAHSFDGAVLHGDCDV